MILNFLRGLLPSLSFKLIAWLILIAVVLGGTWYGYEKILDRGIAIGVAQEAKNTKVFQDKAVDLQARLTAANTEIKTNANTYEQWKAEALKNNAAAQAAQEKINKDLSDQLAQTQEALATTKKLKDDLSKYISKANDAACTLPNGFVFLYDQSLSAKQPLLNLPAGILAYAPAGISLTDATRVVLDNNAAARQYRDALIGWQQWYSQVEVILKKYHVPVAPAPTSTTY